jgi:hypothetical protein
MTIEFRYLRTIAGTSMPNELDRERFVWLTPVDDREKIRRIVSSNDQVLGLRMRTVNDVIIMELVCADIVNRPDKGLGDWIAGSGVDPKEAQRIENLFKEE